MLAGVKLLGRKKDNPPPDDGDGVEVTADSEADAKAGRHHGPQGQADARSAIRRAARGPIAPAPMTSAEARKQAQGTARAEAVA